MAEDQKQQADKQEQADRKSATEPQQAAQQPAQQLAQQPQGSSSGGYLVWVILAGIIVVSAAGGYGAAKIFARTGPGAESPLPPPQPQAAQDAGAPELLSSGKAQPSQGGWSIDLEPVIANLNEPGVTRYVRATLTLEMSAEADKEKAKKFIEDRIPAVRNWLTIYLAGLTVEDVKGSKNLRRVQTQIQDSLNELLFGDGKPLISKILFKEFAIQ
jgi:flagellar basal body-associated protein FliL